MSQFALFCRHVAFLAQKEMRSLVKDPRMRVQLVVPVLIMGFLFGYAANYNIEDIPYVAIDASHTAASTDFLAHVEGAPAFHCVAAPGNIDAAKDLLDTGEALAILTVPETFERQLAAGETAPVQVIADGRNPALAGMIERYIARIAADWSAAQSCRTPAVTLETRTWYNPNQLSRWTFLPSFLAMIAFVQVMMLAGMSIAREREQGTFDQLLVTPLSKTAILIGKAIPPVAVGLFQAMCVFLIARFWFGVPFAGNFATLMLTLFLFMVSTTGVGLSISSISRNMQQVLVYLLVLMIPMVLLSGLVTPVRNMPAALQVATYADPLRFAIDAVRRIYLEGATLGEIAPDFLPMLGVAAVTMPLSGWLFRRRS